ncbi:hypothetical protein F511_20219 [Dorcoceras hygrometricum]|uniref:RRM domain-containing protein n=1 Tax=Dorcoceras hygrometricum TaxID=472368 RepID=A0A2Z7BLF8_9LAMI|nr:hypothetical protein F511_20219 [Dorcoceras hygrometricum]
MCIRLPKPLNPNAEAWTPKQIALPAALQPETAVPVLAATAASYPTVYKMSQQSYYQQLTIPHIFFPAANGFHGSDSGEKIHILRKNSKIQNARKADGPMRKCPCPPLDSLKKGVQGNFPPRLRRPVRSVSVDNKPPKLGWRPRTFLDTAGDGDAVELPRPRASPPMPQSSGQGFSPSWNTTVMIKNIPNRLRRDDILKFLDGHCCAYSLEYDFLYLPMDFRKKGNLGYAFVNFTSPISANKFKKILQNFKWETGKEVYTRRFKDAEFACHEMDFLPVVLDPPRNGSDPNPCPPLVLGQLQGRFSSKNH